jgi:hypothetical protein
VLAARGYSDYAGLVDIRHLGWSRKRSDATSMAVMKGNERETFRKLIAVYAKREEL